MMDILTGSNHIVTFAIYPLQYIPTTEELRLARSIAFELTYKNSKITPLKVRTRRSQNQKIYNKILKDLIANPEDIPLYQFVPGENRGLGKSSGIQSGPLPAYEYVIITSSALKSAFDPFVSWKTRKGLDIGVVTVEEISSTYTGDMIFRYQ